MPEAGRRSYPDCKEWERAGPLEGGKCGLRADRQQATNRTARLARCGGWSERPPWVLAFGHLISSWWHYLGRVGRGGLA